jgi:pimeloyl-ACP methyl ester carboxylesterase
VVAADRRGSGLNLGAWGDAPSMATLVNDVRAVIDHIQVSARPLLLAGWCWGGALAINVALQFNGLFDGLILLAPALYPSELILATIQSQEKNRADENTYLRTPIREEMFTTGPYLHNYILKDDSRVLVLTPRFARIMTRMVATARRHVNQLSIPLLLLIADKDVTVDNDKLLASFRSLNCKSVVCNSHHGLQFEVPEPVAITISRWTKHLATTRSKGINEIGGETQRQAPTTKPQASTGERQRGRERPNG